MTKAPGLAFVVVATLAAAIGATTAIFSVVESVLLQPLPYPDEDRIVRVAATVHRSERSRGDRGNAFSDRGYWHFANKQRSFEKFGAYWGTGWFPLTGDGPPRRVGVVAMTRSAFEVLGVAPQLGRLPTPEEDAPGGPAIMLLSHDVWVGQYGADPSIIGRVVALNGTPREVIGVMPAGYDFPSNFPEPGVEVWTPLQLDPAGPDFGDHYLSAIARLAPGVTAEAAIAEARSLVARFGEAGYTAAWFESVFDGGAVVRPLRDFFVGDVRQPLLIVFGTVAFVLLIACSNIANLLLVRADGRRREHAVKLTLGSNRARLARSVLVESTLLALAGGAAGVLLADVATKALVAIGPGGLPRLDDIEVSGRALAFSTGVSVLAAMLFGVLPALASSSATTLSALRDGGHGSTLGHDRHRARSALVTAQVALAFVLVIGSGLMVRSFEALRSVDAGFSTDDVLTFRVQPLATKYASPEALARFYTELLERMAAVSGVVRAGAINTLPLTGANCCAMATRIDEFPADEGALPPVFAVRRATQGYFEAMGIPLVEGRTFTTDDHVSRLDSVIVSRSVKDRYWPATSALGKGVNPPRVTAQVVGVVGDVHDRGLDASADLFAYLPLLDAGTTDSSYIDAMTITLRTEVDPLSLVGAIRSAIAELDADLPVTDVRTMQRVLADSVSRTSFVASALAIAAAVALFLGSLGIYGVLSYVVSQRTPEIGIRTALGATPANVRRMILSQGLWLAGAGVLLGLVGATALARLIAAQLHGVTPFDPVTIAAAVAIFAGVALLACLLPAARAANTSPLDALRTG